MAMRIDDHGDFVEDPEPKPYERTVAKVKSDRKTDTERVQAANRKKMRPVRCLDTGDVFAYAGDAYAWATGRAASSADAGMIRKACRTGCCAYGLRFEYAPGAKATKNPKPRPKRVDVPGAQDAPEPTPEPKSAPGITRDSALVSIGYLECSMSGLRTGDDAKAHLRRIAAYIVGCAS